MIRSGWVRAKVRVDRVGPNRKCAGQGVVGQGGQGGQGGFQLMCREDLGVHVALGELGQVVGSP